MADKKRLIYANELKAELLRLSFSPAIVMSAIERTPTVDAVPVVHGEWIHHYRDSGEPIDDKWYCSECHMCNAHRRTWYCPDCGAKMDGDTNG